MISKDDIELAREIIEKNVIDTPHGKGLSLDYCLLRAAVDSVEALQRENEVLLNKIKERI